MKANRSSDAASGSGARPTSDSLRIEVEDRPAAEDLASLDDRLQAFTLVATGHNEPRPFAVFARDDSTIVGGAHGWTWGECCEVVALWVNEPVRHRGLGRRLLESAEAEASARGCQQMITFTHDVQAPGFYSRAGYELVGRLDDYPARGAAFWFRKRLDHQPPPIVQRAVRTALWVGVTALLIGEGADRLRALRRAASHRVAAWFDELERQDRTETRRTELATLALATRRSRRRPRVNGRRRAADVVSVRRRPKAT